MSCALVQRARHVIWQIAPVTARHAIYSKRVWSWNDPIGRFMFSQLRKSSLSIVQGVKTLLANLFMTQRLLDYALFMCGKIAHFYIFIVWCIISLGLFIIGERITSLDCLEAGLYFMLNLLCAITFYLWEGYRF